MRYEFGELESPSVSEILILVNFVKIGLMLQYIDIFPVMYVRRFASLGRSLCNGSGRVKGRLKDLHSLQLKGRVRPSY